MPFSTYKQGEQQVEESLFENIVVSTTTCDFNEGSIICDWSDNWENGPPQKRN